MPSSRTGEDLSVTCVDHGTETLLTKFKAKFEAKKRLFDVEGHLVESLFVCRHRPDTGSVLQV